MCSREPDEFEDGGVQELQAEVLQKLDLEDVMCKKCGVQKANLMLRVNDTYCTSCLQVAVTHKFRACLGKSKMMRSGEKVLLAYSGGQASTAMLKLTQEGLAITTYKKLRFVPTVIYIDEGALLNIPCSSRKETLKKISSVTRSCGFPAYVSTIEMVMNSNNDGKFVEMPENVEDFHLFDDKDGVKKFRELFDSVESLSSKQDLLLKLRSQLLVQIAIGLGCTKILLGDSETRIAVRVLADIALGKGKHLAQNCGFSDGRHEGVILIRPLREILSKEISFFVNAAKFPIVFQPDLTTKKISSSSIQQKTEAFVLGLQENFPATVSTIFRTGDKMGSAIPNSQSSSSEIETICILCDAVVDKPSFSETLCCTIGSFEKLEEKSGDCDNCKCSPQNAHVTLRDLMKLACHSCSLIFKEMNDTKNIPPCVLEKATKIRRREKMRSEIAEFLLES